MSEPIIVMPASELEARIEQMLTRILERHEANKPEKLMDSKEARTLLNVSNVTLWKYVNAGKLTPLPRTEKRAKLLFRAEDVRSLIGARYKRVTV